MEFVFIFVKIFLLAKQFEKPDATDKFSIKALPVFLLNGNFPK